MTGEKEDREEMMVMAQFFFVVHRVLVDTHRRILVSKKSTIDTVETHDRHRTEQIISSSSH